MDAEASCLALLERMLLDESAEPTDLPISLLKRITKDFSHDLQIGYGGFAVVYKGYLGNGGTIAVKKLSNSIDMDETKYNREVGCLMRVRHKNIVRFLGYCADTQGKMLGYEGKFVMADVRQRLLCFEYLRKGSLVNYIKDSSCGLEWRERYQIIKGICEGLHYLHTNNIVHLDLKPSNILLDNNMVPKISDFGLSRMFNENQSRAIVSSKLFGSTGYAAPEYYGGVISFKSDIYSLGAILTEILTGQKGYCSVDNVLESWKNRLDISLADTQLEQVKVCAEISIDCMHLDPDKRPVIQHIIHKLGETESIQLQCTNQLTLEPKLMGQREQTTYNSTESTNEFKKYSIINSLVAQIAPTPLFVQSRSATGGEVEDIHSLAERVRREKISQRMKLLQGLVPGCDKIGGKALMLDEIINYVQSLQRQVEFMSIKMASGNPQLDFNNLPNLLPKDD